MIKGFGIDIVDIDRIAGMIDKYGRVFLDKVYTEAEIAFCGGMARPPVHYAGRWAIKEAFYKALPPECQHFSSWKSIEAVPGHDSRASAINVKSAELKAKMDDCGIASIFFSLSHEKTHCVAAVVLEGR